MIKVSNLYLEPDNLLIISLGEETLQRYFESNSDVFVKNFFESHQATKKNNP